MKRVLITGQNSYVGNSFKQWINENHSSSIQVDSISVRDDSWNDIQFSTYDTVLHVAGIAHVPSNDNMKALYEEVNAKLPYKIAEKAKQEGVKQFIFMSSMIVFGNGDINNRLIDENTSPNPIDVYGESKLNAETLLSQLEDSHFHLAIVRPPMVYGPNSKGNFPLLLKFSNKVPFFPAYSNERSMIFIDNLTECLAQIILTEFSGVVHPQNPQYMNTKDIIKWIRDCQNKQTFSVRFINPLITLGIKKSRTLQKIFGDFAYHQKLSKLPFEYQIVDSQESIRQVVEKTYE